MRFVIKHEIKGRIRIHLVQKRMTLQQADILQYYLEIQENIETARIQERTCDATICYHGSRNAIPMFCLLKNMTGCFPCCQVMMKLKPPVCFWGVG